ncbi:MAG TPA: DF family (seleno)protein [Candidatus Avalokitesvara rifleensis]|uniref:DF family (seleno)protein n=1 Tax=Candidatus Avalokitesvara rifleensis TaxID=3367620 RepID=UPI002713E4D7|nr:DUF2703 domain-containing protein [Candidatus Brocadiales bacterium]
MELNVQLLHTLVCHGYQKAMIELEGALEEAGLPVRFEVTLVNSRAAAEQYKFIGSPTIRINGVDIELEAAGVEKFGLDSCRPYFWKDKFYDYPPKDMILSALKKHSVTRAGS